MPASGADETLHNPTNRARLVLAGIFLAVAAFSGSVQAEFYKGKRITLIINYPVGGPTDIEGRLVARHLAKHIPGNPRILVKNVPGAGGITGTNYMGQAAKPDGFTLAIFAPPIMQWLLNDTGLRVDLSRFVWLGGMGQSQVCFIRSDAGGGISKADDLLRIDEFKLAGVRPTAMNDVKLRMALDLLGAKYKYVTGYRGMANILAGIMQNEVQYTCTSLPVFYQSVEPNLIRTGDVVPLWYYSAIGLDGAQVNESVLEGIPAFVEVYQSIHGHRPSGMLYDTFRLLNNLSSVLLRAFFVPEATPDEAVETLRAAWHALTNDQDFAAEYAKMAKAPANLLSSAAVEAHVQATREIPPATLTFIKEFITK